MCVLDIALIALLLDQPKSKSGLAYLEIVTLETCPNVHPSVWASTILESGPFVHSTVALSTSLWHTVGRVFFAEFEGSADLHKEPRRLRPPRTGSTPKRYRVFSSNAQAKLENDVDRMRNYLRRYV